MIDNFKPPVAVMPSDQAFLLLGNLRATQTSEERLWLHVSTDFKKEVLLLAGLSWDALLQSSATPYFSVVLYPELKAVLEENMIYKATSSDMYYLELLQCDNSPEWRLYAKYQIIIGSRLLYRPEAGFVAAMRTALASQLMEQARCVPAAAKVDVVPTRCDFTEQDELLMLAVHGDRIKLPLHPLNHYQRIKTMLEQAGGSYAKGGYFDFEAGIDASTVLEELRGGKKVNAKKEHQYFATPSELARSVCEAVGSVAGKRILEPSAGDGALADIVKRSGAEVLVVENWKVNVLKLEAKGYKVIDRDFLTLTPDELGVFDAIVANPPFTKGSDITHVEHMWKFLKPGGVLSVLMSSAWLTGRQKRQVAFRMFLENNGAVVEKIPSGAFKTSGTNVATVHITMTKALASVGQAAQAALV